MNLVGGTAIDGRLLFCHSHRSFSFAWQTDEARRAIYDRARTALREALHNYDPPLSETELANEQAALDAAISTVEVVNDIRPGGSEESS